MEALGWARAMPTVALTLGAGLAAMTCDDAAAAVLSGLATSVGLFATLLSVGALVAGAAVLPGTAALSTAGAALLVAAGASVWRRRSRSMGALVRSAVGSTSRAVARAQAIQDPNWVDQWCQQFVRLQAAWDLREAETLRRLTTPQMLEDLRYGLAGRVECDAPCTEVVTLHAEILEFGDSSDLQVANVVFSGLLRESPERGAVPFRELWMLTRSKRDESGWKLARQHTLF